MDPRDIAVDTAIIAGIDTTGLAIGADSTLEEAIAGLRPARSMLQM